MKIVGSYILTTSSGQTSFDDTTDAAPSILLIEPFVSSSQLFPNDTLCECICSKTTQRRMVRCITKDPTADPKASIHREISIGYNLVHPNILTVVDVVRTRGNSQTLYVVYDGVPGILLKDMLRYIFKGPAPEEVVKGIIRMIVAALLHCHKLSIAHRNLTLSTILYYPKEGDSTQRTLGTIKVSGFEHAMVFAQDNQRHTVSPSGDPNFVSPEVLLKLPHNPFKADVWSIGVMTFGMLQGMLPFRDRTLMGIIRKGLASQDIIQHQLHSNHPEGGGGRGADVSKGVVGASAKGMLSHHAKDFMFRCMASDPEDRMSLEEAANH
eukprot:PhF_6_TR12322/c0_g1_i2/m.19572/K08794/CAMK1; calcium/calmodulin-dependent protein kinase I